MSDTGPTDPVDEALDGDDDERVGLEHGAGGAATRDLVSEVLTAGFPADDATVGLADRDTQEEPAGVTA